MLSLLYVCIRKNAENCSGLEGSKFLIAKEAGVQDRRCGLV